MPIRTLLAAMALLTTPTLALQPGSAGPNDLTIVTRDESMRHAMQSAYAEPFTAVTGIPVQQNVWEGGIDALRAQVKANDNSWDLVLVDADELTAGCGAGLVDNISWPARG